MFRLLICGCLLAVLAVAQAGVIAGGLLGPAAVAVQPAAATVAIPSIATSTSNLIRGIGNLAPGLLAPGLIAPGLTTAYGIASPAITAAGLPLGLNGLALNGLGAVKVI
ncbi:uncharacterized protein LOC108630582 isoform X2 [Ceratina calcarata]|uniref:Uncharacterized protein LOC108630582 isoform X2 n=1 Tax=Ceratina calcarata TaxID=156304 RepID=A0AAJ7SA01_9HYME|nr:uncharacterized protein LOC108630582 isoform X2 [Ceratina calcarata]